jgi:hypothetical protein
MSEYNVGQALTVKYVGPASFVEEVKGDTCLDDSKRRWFRVRLDNGDTAIYPASWVTLAPLPPVLPW